MTYSSLAASPGINQNNWLFQLSRLLDWPTELLDTGQLATFDQTSGGM